ncbi:MAG: type II toxin-antitoxin system HipA family toxin [Eubacterium sp.]|nr:type II toxin-antitoxin system HipA family toxin [Eubacterium sp.]
MSKLYVSIEKNGVLTPVGTIEGKGPSSARFRYDRDYLRSSDAVQVSISLPLREKPFSAAVTAAFFEGLLPEGFTRRTVAQWMHVDEGDYLPILHGLGRECLGALCITEDGDSMDASYEPISSDRVRELAAEGASRSAELVTNAHLSLTGASGKAGLYHADGSDQWYLPLGLAPSTHIVKQSHVRFDNIVLNEQLAQMTAEKCGIKVPKSFIINTGNGGEGEVLLATERYDRVMDPPAGEIDGLARPYRLHQEDFAQVMGIPAYSKYEQAGDNYLPRMFDVLRAYSSDPVADQVRLWDTIVFDYLIGNTDAHLKNFSLLYSSDLRTMRLSPAYDIVSTAVYEQSTRELAIHIGGASTLDEVTKNSFRQAAEEAGLGARMAMRRLDQMQSRFTRAINKSAEELTAAGFINAEEMEKRMLEHGGIAKLG